MRYLKHRIGLIQTTRQDVNLIRSNFNDVLLSTILTMKHKTSIYIFSTKKEKAFHNTSTYNNTITTQSCIHGQQSLKIVQI